MLKRILTVLSLLALTSCSGNILDQNQVSPQQEQEKAEEGPRKRLEVALLLPLSGDHADVGNNMLNATSLAFKELKAKNFNITPIDTTSEVIHSESVLEILGAKKYDIILGPILSHHTKVIYSYAYKHHIPLISFSNDISLLNNEGLFLIGVMPDQVVNHVVNYSALNGYENIFALLPDNRYGLLIENVIKAHGAEGKYQVIDIAKYMHSQDRSISSAENALTIIKAALIKQAAAQQNKENNFALLIPEGGEFTKNITKDLHKWGLENKIKFKFLGSNQWDNELLIVEKHLNGSWIANSPNIHLKKFEQRFYDTYGEKPYKISSLAYDAAALVTVLANSDNIQTALLDENGFLGASGIFRFRSNGSNERMLSIFEIQNGKLIEINPAKTSF